MNNTYYDFKQDSEIGVDIETKDPLLKQKGNGVYRKDGYVIGVAFSNGNISEYYPIKHPDTDAKTEERNRKYIEDQLAYNNTKIFANGLYDLDWLLHYENMVVNGSYEDVQIAEPLIDEYRRSYSLDSQAQHYLKETKDTYGLREYCIQQGFIKSSNTKSTGNEFLWKTPQAIAEDYAKHDPYLTYKIFQKQKDILHEQGLWDIYNIEMRLFPLLLQMRKIGVRVNEENLYKLGMELSDLRYDLQKDLNSVGGFEVNPNSNKDLEKLFIAKGLPVIYREPTDLMYSKGIFRGNPRFDKETLKTVHHPLAKKILELRHIRTLLDMFVHPYPELMVGGRLHCQFNPLKSDEYGTVSGRFSSSNPNLQQVSGKKEEEHIHSNSELLNGAVIRKLFMPEDDHDWLKGDWSQIEYRLIAHYALGEGSDVIRKRYNEDPNVDYHEELGLMTGIEDRKVVKTLNFGAAYGMGVNKMTELYGWDPQDANAVYTMYHDKVPFVKETGRRVSMKSKRTGFIKTILKRRARLPASNKAYVMFNRLIQGSAADIMKKAMVDAYEAKLFTVLVPHLTVHDEMDCSIPRTKEGKEAGKELKHIMETCVSLRVPIKADFEIGKNWGELEEWKI